MYASRRLRGGRSDVSAQRRKLTDQLCLVNLLSFTANCPARMVVDILKDVLYAKNGE